MHNVHWLCLCGNQSHIWPLLHMGANGWAPFVSDWVALPLSEQLIQQGRSGSALFLKENFPMIALRIEF